MKRRWTEKIFRYVVVKIENPYKFKTAIFYEKSDGFTYLGLAVALATWYNNLYDTSVKRPFDTHIIYIISYTEEENCLEQDKHPCPTGTKIYFLFSNVRHSWMVYFHADFWCR